MQTDLLRKRPKFFASAVSKKSFALNGLPQAAGTIERRRLRFPRLELVAHRDPSGDTLTLPEVARDAGVKLQRTRFGRYKGHAGPDETAAAAEVGLFEPIALDAAARLAVKLVLPGRADIRPVALVARVTQLSAQARSVRLNGVEVELVFDDAHVLAFEIAPEVRGIDVKVKLIGQRSRSRPREPRLRHKGRPEPLASDRTCR